MEIHKADNRGLLQALLGDGRPFLIFGGLCLVLSGCFALFLSATGHFLPHDVQFLGMTAERLCGIARLGLGGYLSLAGFLDLAASWRISGTATSIPGMASRLFCWSPFSLSVCFDRDRSWISQVVSALFLSQAAGRVGPQLMAWAEHCCWQLQRA